MSDRYTPPKCADCGKFLGADEICSSRCEFTPLNEFGPEEIEWTCPRCLVHERKQRVCHG